MQQHNAPDSADAPLNYHAILVEMRELQKKGLNKTRWNDLYTQLSNMMFTDFVKSTDVLSRDLTSHKYSVNIEETEDFLQNALIRIYNRIDSYHGTSDGEAQNWIRVIIKRLVQDNAKKVNRRVAKWEPFIDKVKRFCNKFGADKSSED